MGTHSDERRGIPGALTVAAALAFSLCAWALPARAHHIPEAVGTDIVDVFCQKPKDSIWRAGKRHECDLDATKTLFCDNGDIIHAGELNDPEPPPGCTESPYGEGVWRNYNENRDPPGLLLNDPDGVCQPDYPIYVCVGSPRQFSW